MLSLESCNLGIPSPEHHQQRKVLDSAPFTHNVPDVPMPVTQSHEQFAI